MAKVYAPLQTYNGVSASVRFANGVGETSDPDLLAWFREHGYKVLDAEEVEKPKRKSKKGE